MSIPAASLPPEVPLEIEPVLGWRVWILTRNFLGDLRLQAVAHPVTWEPQEVVPAACQGSGRFGNGHKAPVAQCHCGYYAADSLESFSRARVYNYGAGVLGAIAMWGTVIQHQHGARSEFAYPARMRLVCSHCLKQGRVVDPVVVVGDTRLTPVCARHARSEHGTRVPAAQVQAELLSTYAVDLLPKPKLPGLSRFRPGEPMHPAKDGLTLIAIGIFWVIRFVISAVMLLWIAGIVFTVVAVLLGFLVRLWPGGEPVFPVPTPTPVVSVAPPTRMDRAWHRIAPHRGVPLPAPIPAFAAPCGVGHGDFVELVACGDPRVDLLGFGVQERPHGSATDCTRGSDAYSHGSGWWVCWLGIHDAWVHPWATSPNPFGAPPQIGGVLDGDR